MLQLFINISSDDWVEISEDEVNAYLNGLGPEGLGGLNFNGESATIPSSKDQKLCSLNQFTYLDTLGSKDKV